MRAFTWIDTQNTQRIYWQVNKTTQIMNSNVNNKYRPKGNHGFKSGKKLIIIFGDLT